jgi:outer membrane protein
MKRVTLGRLCVGLIGLMVAFFQLARAEETITLEEAVSRALKNNSYVKSRAYGVQASKEALNASTGAFFPRLSFVERYTRGDYNSYAVFTRLNQETLTFSNFLNAGTVSNFYTGVSLEMPIFVPGLFVTKDMKQVSFLSSSKEFERFKEEIVFTVFTTYLSAVKTKAVQELAAKSVDEARELHRVAKAKVARGMGLHSDELRAFVFLKEKEAFLIKTENDLYIARMGLSLLLSEDDVYDVAPVSSLKNLILPPLDEALAQSLKNRADYVSDEYQAKNASHNLSLQRSRFYPRFHLDGTYARDGQHNPLGAEGDGWVGGISLRWDIFDKTLFDDISKARFEEMKSKEYLAQRKREIAFQINESYRRVDEAKRRLDVSTEAVAQAEESFRLIKLRYENNLSTMVELLDAEKALVQAKSNAIIFQSERYEAVGRTLFSAGLLLSHLPGTK